MNELQFNGSKDKGRLAEAKAVSYLIENGYEVYIPFSGNSKYDVLAVKDGQVNRISVKYTSQLRESGNWNVTMVNVSRRNHGKVKVDSFDKTQFDLVLVYVGPLDKVVAIDANQAAGKSLTVYGYMLE